MQADDVRPPLCVYCVAGTFFPAGMVLVHYYARVNETETEPIPLGLMVDELDNTLIIKHGTTPLNICAGNAPLFVKIARALGERPGLQWQINASRVGVWAEFEYFGTKVCATHIHDAISAWNRVGQRGIGGRI